MFTRMQAFPEYIYSFIGLWTWEQVILHSIKLTKLKYYIVHNKSIFRPDNIKEQDSVDYKMSLMP